MDAVAVTSGGVAVRPTLPESVESEIFDALESGDVDIGFYRCLAEMIEWGRAVLASGELSPSQVEQATAGLARWEGEFSEVRLHLARAIEELGFDLVVARRFLASEAEAWARLGRKCGYLAADFTASLMREFRATAEARMEKGGNPVIRNQRRFRRACAARKGA